MREEETKSTAGEKLKSTVRLSFFVVRNLKVHRDGYPLRNLREESERKNEEQSFKIIVLFEFIYVLLSGADKMHLFPKKLLNVWNSVREKMSLIVIEEQRAIRVSFEFYLY